MKQNTYAFERRRPPGQGGDLDSMLKSLSTFNLGGRLRGGLAGIWIILLLVALLIWLASGIYTVDPSEEAVVRQFGRITTRVRIGPGLHWRWPAPIERVDIIKVLERKRMEVGFRTISPGPSASTQTVPTEALMITGDENIVDVEMLVQYEIKDIFQYLFKVYDTGDRERGVGNRPDGITLKDAAESALRQVVGSRPIDDVLTEKRVEVENETHELLQQLMDNYQTGIKIVQVQLQTVRPPDPVQAAFNDVVSAKEDKQRIINLAQAYRADILPKARGEAQQMLRQAEAFRSARVAEATGEASRFLQVLQEYQKAKDITRQRLYLETMESILPGIKKFIITPQSGGNLLQFLPLEQTGGAAQQAAAAAAGSTGTPSGVQGGGK